MKSILKYAGGKSYLAKKIVALMPKHITYCEPFFGSGAVLFEKNPENISEVVNDIDGELMNFWKVLQEENSFNQFKRLIEATPFSQVEFELCKENDIFIADGYDEPVGRAAAFFVKCRQSFAGGMKSFTAVTKTRTRGGMNAETSAWLSAIELLPEIHNRLKRVLILNEDAFDVIKRLDGKDTLFYCDLPYLHETRNSKKLYKYEMTDEDHEKFLLLLSSIKGKFLLSGYESPLYNSFAQKFNWKVERFDIANHMSSSDTKPKMVEMVWMN